LHKKCCEFPPCLRRIKDEKDLSFQWKWECAAEFQTTFLCFVFFKFLKKNVFLYLFSDIWTILWRVPEKIKRTNLLFKRIPSLEIPGVNFINILGANFAPIFWCQKLQSWNVSRESCAKPFCTKKRSNQMLMKSTPQVSEDLLELIWLNVEVLWMWIDLDTHRTLKINLQSSGCCRVFQKWHLLQSDVLMLRQISATG